MGGALLAHTHSSRASEDLARGSFACLYLLSAYSALVDCAPLLAEACGVADRVQALADALAPKPSFPGPACQEEGLALMARPLLTSAPEPCEQLVHRFEAGGALGPLLTVDSLRLWGRASMQLGPFTLRPGMHVLLCGPSGCGKSTLLQVLAGERPAGLECVGQVRVWCPRARLFVSQQSPFCFRGSLRANLTYPAAPQPSQSEGLAEERLRCEKALRASGLGERFVACLGPGEEPCEEWTQVTSLGERQRLALARLLLRDPSPLIVSPLTCDLPYVTYC